MHKCASFKLKDCVPKFSLQTFINFSRDSLGSNKYCFQVRYVAFDSLGHKLITGIANSPQTRWERVRAPVPIAHQGPGANSYRRRITQRLVSQFKLILV